MSLGLRSDLAEGKLRLNATLFHTEWNDIQLAGESIDDCVNPPVVGTNLRTQNVASAEAEGVEVELSIAPTDSLLFNVNLGLLDTKYVGITTPVPGLTLNTEFSQAPEKTGNVGVSAHARLGGGGTFIRVSTTTSPISFGARRYRTSERNTMDSLSEFDEGGDYGLGTCGSPTRHRAPLGSSPIFGTNLTDEYYLNSGFFHSLWDIDFATVGRPREAGVELEDPFRLGQRDAQ